ncbi:MAG: hypothetical protein AAB370_10725 [Verrucomicrobiota bacterium]
MSQFIEGYSGPVQVHPHASPLVVDGREEVVRRIDGDPDPTIERLAHERSAESLRRFFETVMGDVKLGRGCQRDVGRRFILALWIINPEIVGGGEAISLTQLAKKFRYTTPALSPITAELSRRLGLKNFYQAHDSQPGRTDHDSDEADSDGDGDDEETEHEGGHIENS